MKTADQLGFSMVLGIGLWWLLFPRSVAAFYCWLHSRRRETLKMPAPFAIRVIGLLWIALVITVTLISIRRR